MNRRVWGILLLPVPAWAAAPDVSIVTMLLSLGLVLALIFGLAWLLRRLKLPGLANQPGGIKIVSQLAVGQKERILVVDIHGEQLVVGVTPSNIQLLKTLDNPLPTATSVAAPNSRFATQLSQLLNRK
ncbi:flagellar biosynthetic protein FliO [Salinivibrio sp. ES.052]|uniref:flagellar biosynthetic protein FliO n=1 Tax=Salinivibrio sp. ES.052 TaxID=1882823 RepID=UPI000926B199|nr:flagellar biosynthetic protein FliO [Salinivibrio sp. ES.052]SIN75670.1 flagellar protein FliO/FliZ [Salinivibrio sp. ES.052]